MSPTFLRRRADLAAAALLCLATVLAFGLRVWHGDRFSNFSDEANHFLGAKVIAAGGRLYRDYVDQHGPLIFALPQLFGALLGWANPTYTRICQPVLAAATTAAIIGCPSLRTAWERLTAASLFLGLLASVWLVQALCMVLYQPVAGFVVLIGLAQFSLPEWQGTPARPGGAFIAGLAFALTPFLGFSYGPAAALLAMAGVVPAWQRRGWRILFCLWAGMALAVSGMAVWMAIFGDFTGYLVYHILAPLTYFAPYLGFGAMPMLHVLRPDWRPDHLVQTLGVCAAICGISALIAARLRVCGASLSWLLSLALFAAGMIATNPRGSAIFQNGAFMISAFGLAALAFPIAAAAFSLSGTKHSKIALSASVFAAVIAAEMVVRHAVETPHGYTRAQMATAETGGLGELRFGWGPKVRLAADPGERVLAVPFYPEFYLVTGRLPISGYFDYLPWDADYARHPLLGLDHDLCRDLPRDLPPVIFYNAWVVWGRYDPQTYMACLPKLLASNYAPMLGEVSIYVRLDRLARVKAFFSEEKNQKTFISAPARTARAIENLSAGRT